MKSYPPKEYYCYWHLGIFQYFSMTFLQLWTLYRVHLIHLCTKYVHLQVFADVYIDIIHFYIV